MDSSETHSVTPSSAPSDLPDYLRSNEPEIPLVPVRRRRRAPLIIAGVLGAALVTVAAFAVAAGSKERSSSLALAAYNRTLSSGSARIATVVSVSASGQHANSTDAGVFSWRDGRGQLTSKLFIASQSLTINSIYDGPNTYINEQFDGARPELLSTLKLPVGDSWSEATWSGGRPGTTSDLGVFGLLDTAGGRVSPESVLALLNTQARSQIDVGNERLAGVVTTHYRVDVPLTALGGHPSLDEIKSMVRLLGRDSIQVDFWLDSNSQQLRQLVVGFAMRTRARSTDPNMSGHAGDWTTVTVSATLSLSDYGVPVSVTLPPANKIVSHTTCSVTDNGFICT